MKKILSIALTFSFMLLMSACSSNTIESDKMTINRAELTEEEQNILDLVNVDKNPYLWDFTLDDTVKSMTTITYELVDGDWNEVAYSSEQFEDLDGRIALVFDNVADGVTTGVESESKGGSQSYAPEHDINFEGMASTTSTLSNPYDIVYDEEIPLVIQIHTTSDSIKSTNPEYGFFEDLDNYKNYEKVYAITVTFSQQTMAELDELQLKD